MTAEATTYQPEPTVPPEEFDAADFDAAHEPAEPVESSTYTPGRHIQRPDGITLVAGYHYLIGALLLLGTCAMAIPTVITGIVGLVEDPGAFIATFILGVVGTIVMLLSLLYLAVGYGLWTQRQWARTAAMALGVVSLFAVPIGTATGGLTLWYLMKPEVAVIFE